MIFAKIFLLIPLLTIRASFAMEHPLENHEISELELLEESILETHTVDSLVSQMYSGLTLLHLLQQSQKETARTKSFIQLAAEKLTEPAQSFRSDDFNPFEAGFESSNLAFEQCPKANAETMNKIREWCQNLRQIANLSQSHSQALQPESQPEFSQSESASVPAFSNFTTLDPLPRQNKRSSVSLGSNSELRKRQHVDSQAPALLLQDKAHYALDCSNSLPAGSHGACPPPTSNPVHSSSFLNQEILLEDEIEEIQVEKTRPNQPEPKADTPQDRALQILNHIKKGALVRSRQLNSIDTELKQLAPRAAYALLVPYESLSSSFSLRLAEYSLEFNQRDQATSHLFRARHDVEPTKYVELMARLNNPAQVSLPVASAPNDPKIDSSKITNAFDALEAGVTSAKLKDLDDIISTLPFNQAEVILTTRKKKDHSSIYLNTDISLAGLAFKHGDKALGKKYLDQAHPTNTHDRKRYLKLKCQVELERLMSGCRVTKDEIDQLERYLFELSPRAAFEVLQSVSLSKALPSDKSSYYRVATLAASLGLLKISSHFLSQVPNDYREFRKELHDFSRLFMNDGGDLTIPFLKSLELRNALQTLESDVTESKLNAIDEILISTPYFLSDQILKRRYSAASQPHINVILADVRSKSGKQVEAKKSLEFDSSTLTDFERLKLSRIRVNLGLNSITEDTLGSGQIREIVSTLSDLSPELAIDVLDTENNRFRSPVQRGFIIGWLVHLSLQLERIVDAKRYANQLDRPEQQTLQTELHTHIERHSQSRPLQAIVVQASTSLTAMPSDSNPLHSASDKKIESAP